MEQRPHDESLKRKHEEEKEQRNLKRAKVLQQNPRKLWNLLGTREQFPNAIKKCLCRPHYKPDSFNFSCAFGLIVTDCDIDHIPYDENFKKYIENLKYNVNVNCLYEITFRLLYKTNRTSQENEFLRSCVEMLPDINRNSKDGEGLLIKAIRYQNTEIAKLLIELGANPNQRNQQDETPLMHAVNASNIELVTFLLEHGADATINSQFLLALASCKRNEQIRKLICNAINVKAMQS